MKRLFAFIAPLISCTSHAYDHTLTIESTGGTTLPAAAAGDRVHLLLDTSPRNQQIWGSVQIEYDPLMLKALYVDESFDLYGYMTWWIDAPGVPEYCGGGIPYFYGLQSGSTRADQYALEYGDGVAGPSAYIDQTVGRIRFYQQNFLEDSNYSPLLIGFEILNTGNTTITVKSQSEYEEYGWCTLEQTLSSDSLANIIVTDTSFIFGGG